MKMKLQQITRGTSKYYHVYLPKSIVERVLHWHQGDNLEYKVINDNLVLKKLPHPVNKFLEELSCPICFNHCVVIKVIKNPKRNEFKIVARCPLDYTPVRAFFSESTLGEWKWYLHETVNICDVCGGLLEEQIRKHSRSIARPYYKLVLRCRECGRKRVKVIADEILQVPEEIPENISPPIIQKNTKLKHKVPPKSCPTCDEEVLADTVFCGQCGTCLINGEF